MFCCTLFAADLNPFAYDLKTDYNESTLTLTLKFTLNAPATYVKLAIMDGANEVWTKEYLASSYQSNEVPKTTYTEVIDAKELPSGVNLTWRVDVKGEAVNSMTFVKNDVRLYAPTSVDIDNNPQNETFGTVFVAESRSGGLGNSKYKSSVDGAGLYILNADGSARRMPNQSTERYGYNGGRVNQSAQYFNGSAAQGYSPFRVRVSDCGRVFLSSMTPDGEVLWEADTRVFSRPDDPNWQTWASAGWSRVMSAQNDNTYMATSKRNCSHTYCGIYGLYQGNASTGAFIAGPNVGFDVRGSGENLQLLMLSGCKEALVVMTPAHFYCSEYDLGTAKKWEKAPSRRIFAGHVVNRDATQVQYDKDGNVWLCQHRSGTDAATLMKFNRDGSTAYDENPRKPYHRCGAIRFNNDFTQVAIVTRGGVSNYGGHVTIYPVLSNGMPDWNNGTEVNTMSYTNYSLMDFAWDYANNFYIAADVGNGNAGECIAIYAMPHTADKVVSTPARESFSVSCQTGPKYTVTTICDPVDGGSIVCTQVGNARVAGVLTDIESCTQLTLTAIPDDGYKFLNWTDENDNVLSSAKDFTFYVTRDITITANFEPAIYTGIVWKSLFMNGEDIAKESTAYPGTNERLWRLYQVEFEKYNTSKSGDAVRWHYDTHQPTGVSKLQFNVGTFLYYGTRGDYNRDFITAATTNATTPFAWLGDYIEYVSGTTSSSVSHWQYITYLFFNRTSKAYNASEAECTNMVSWTDNTKSFAKDYGMPEYWRPWWAEATCGLKRVMSYSDYMPIKWTQESCASGDVSKLGRFNGTAPTSNKETQPSLWYKWNTAPDGKTYDRSKYLLAWRKGSPTANEIVHHVYESNMELHASYVLKNIDENDRVDPNNHDASNDDVIKLMQNRHWVNLDPDPNVHPTHTLTVTRKLQAGMFNTICLPFGVDLTGLQDNNEYHHPLKNAEAWEYTGTTPTYNESGDPVVVLNFNKVTSLEAGKPYLIKMQRNTDLSEDMTFSTVSCFADLHPAQGGGLIFEPTINPTTVPAGSLILVADNRLALTTQEGTMAGMRGYFRIDESDPIVASDIMEQAAAGRVYLSMKKPVTTSIPVAPEAEKQTQPEVRKVMIDGKIYIVRGEEVYTITGNRVK